MKSNQLIALFLLLAAFAGCKKDEPMPVTQEDIKDTLTLSPSYREVEAEWLVETKITINEAVAEFSADTSFKDFVQSPLQQASYDKETGKRTYRGLIRPLQPEQTYYVRCRALNKYSSYVSEVKQVTTLAFRKPAVSTDSVTEITVSSALLHATLLDRGTDTIPQVGFCFAKHPNVTVEDSCLIATITENADSVYFSEIMLDLEDKTTYYVRAYAINNKGIVYGEERSFTTVEILLPTVSAPTVSEITYTSASVAAAVLADGGAEVTQRGICYATTHNPTTDGTHIAHQRGTGEFTVKLKELTDATTYYVRTYAVNTKGTVYSDEVSFTTQAYGAPTVTTSDITNITYTTATAGGSVTADGGTEIIERGVCYSTSHNPTTSSTKVESNGGVGDFTCNLTGLTAGKTYYVRAYAVNSQGTSYGREKTFTTTAYSLPTVSTTAVRNITYTTATTGGNVTADGGAEVTERGVCYATSKNPTTANTKVVSGSGTGSFTINLTDLANGTIYYVRAYAVNSQGTAYGEAQTFKTATYGAPLVTTSDITNISYTSATAGGSVTSDGGTTVTERGVCYSTSKNPTVDNTKVASGSGTGSYTCNLTGLTEGTIYYVRAYATNNVGTTYGEEKTFSTSAYTIPTVTTSTATNISYTTATVGGNVTADGNQTVTERGVCYSTSQIPTIDDTKVASGGGKGSFTCNLQELTSATTYYFRAYAINSKGLAYGDIKSFSTKKAPVPTVTTYDVSDYSYNTASFFGKATSETAYPVTERGFCYSSTATTPDVSNATKVTCSLDYDYHFMEEGMYQYNATDLTAGTKYYVRAYAVNSAGTAYGAVVSFTTTKANMPSVTTTPIYYYDTIPHVFYDYAICEGNVTSDGGSAVTDRGICYSTSSSPTIADSKVSAGSGTGAFSCKLTGLQDGTQYYYRAYATNNQGTSYGDSYSFTTNSYYVPTVSTTSMYEFSDSLTYTSALAGGNVTQNGGLEVTERGICYSTSTQPTVENSKVVCDSNGLGVFVCRLTDLQDGVKYYIRAYAINAKGVGYGDQKYFTTKAYAVPTLTTTSTDYDKVTYTTAVFKGSVTADGGQPVTERGFCYSKDNWEPTIDSDLKIVSGSGLGDFEAEVTGLKDGTQYQYRAYAINAKGVAYGSRRSVSTPSIPRPSVSTSNVQDITYHTARFSGSASAPDNNYPITERGFCYSTSPEPTVDNATKIVNTQSSSYSYYNDVTGLTENTTYYVRAYATNYFETSYGEEKTFTTVAYTVPTLSTNDPNIVSFESAVCSGKVDTDGGQEVTDRGICYSTSPNPTISDNYVSSGSGGLGDFLCGLGSLGNNVTYYYRAYATNSVGTGYGEEKSFTTVDYETAVIYYTATEKIPTAESWDHNPGIHPWAFENTILSHEFNNGQGAIRFSDRITRIGSSAFRNSTMMTSITIPYSVTNIDSEAFKGCTGLTSIDIPKNVTNISYSIIAECSNITTINVSSENKSYCDINGVLFSKDKTKIIIYPLGRTDGNYSIPNTVKEIESYIFQNNENLTSLVIPEGVTKIPYSMCENCSTLVSVSLPNSLKEVSTYAFKNCISITSLTIPANVTYLGSFCFERCTSLTSITCKALVPPSYNNSFAYNDMSTPLYVPSVSLNTYKNTSGWKDFTNIQPIP